MQTRLNESRTPHLDIFLSVLFRLHTLEITTLHRSSSRSNFPSCSFNIHVERTVEWRCVLFWFEMYNMSLKGKERVGTMAVKTSNGQSVRQKRQEKKSGTKLSCAWRFGSRYLTCPTWGWQVHDLSCCQYEERNWTSRTRKVIFFGRNATLVSLSELLFSAIRSGLAPLTAGFALRRRCFGSALIPLFLRSPSLTRRLWPLA